MSTRTPPARSWSVGSKIAAFTFVLVSALLALLITFINWNSTSMLEQRARDQVAADLNGVANMLDVFNSAMVNDAGSYARQFAAHVPGPFELDGSQLSANGKAVNNDFSIPDDFTAKTGAIAPIFATDGADFVRVTTSLTSSPTLACGHRLRGKEGDSFCTIAGTQAVLSAKVGSC